MIGTDRINPPDRQGENRDRVTFPGLFLVFPDSMGSPARITSPQFVIPSEMSRYKGPSRTLIKTELRQIQHRAAQGLFPAARISRRSGSLASKRRRRVMRSSSVW